MSPDIFTVSALGDLLEIAHERFDETRDLLDEDAAEREERALNALWAHYHALLASFK
jgi:hypothetical protein